MYYKVFIGASELIFHKKRKTGITYTDFNYSKVDFNTWIEAIREAHSANRHYIIDEDGALQNSFRDKHKYIEAAGGLVENNKGELLVIERLAKWDLPKGKIEKGESPQVCALREVEEECGLTSLKLVNELPSTFHTYPLKGENMLKRTYWFKMTVSGNQQPSPQKEEGITKVLFMNKPNVLEAMKSTYPSLLPLFETYVARHK